MPSETTKTLSEDMAFTSVSIYSYSECLTYDDRTGYTVCNGCGAMVEDEYEAASEDELNWHREGGCIHWRDTCRVIDSIQRAFGGLFALCNWCGHSPCDCPF